MTRVTMRDVAQAVGVSPMTVSRALRDDETVSKRTRDAVQRAAAELGYVYDTTAQAFRTQKSGFVAVTLPSINNANFAETYRALSDGLDQTGLQLLLGATNYRVDRETDLVRQLLARNPEALVLTGGAHSEGTRNLVASRGVPVIEMWDLPEAPLGHVVGFDNAHAMQEVVAHLADIGRRKLAFLGAAAGADLRGAARRSGVVDAARALGLPEVEVLEVGPAPVSMRHGAGFVAALGQGIARFDALVCVSDPVAFGALNACHRLGLRVPEDIAITGFGNFEIAAVSEPTLTTVDVGAARIGAEVARLLAGGASADMAHIDVGATLVRGATA